MIRILSKFILILCLILDPVEKVVFFSKSVTRDFLNQANRVHDQVQVRIMPLNHKQDKNWKIVNFSDELAQFIFALPAWHDCVQFKSCGDYPFCI